MPKVVEDVMWDCNSCTLLVGMGKGTIILENSWVISSKDKHTSSFDLVIPLLGIHLREMKTYVHRSIAHEMFIQP